MLQIDNNRFLSDLAALSKVGETSGGGVNRPALSGTQLQADDWFRETVTMDGFEVRRDSAGNLSALFPAADPNAKTLLVGSHLDSVPDGGRFDGALGVLCALATLRAFRDAGEALPFHLEAISFTDEEGTLVGLLGSSAVAGELTREKLQSPRGGRDRLVEGMARAGLTEAGFLDAARDPQSLLGYLEVHIEQGTRLESSGTDIGVVTSIVGQRSFYVRFLGEAAHAGTMPMPDRRDAMWGAAAFIESSRKLVMNHFSPGVANFGQVHVKPGAFNIVPSEVVVSMECRHGTEKDIMMLQEALLTQARAVAAEYSLDVEIEPLGGDAPAIMDEALSSHIEAAADVLNLTHKRLLSFALHDPAPMSHITPSAMLFVPSVNGISHNPAEFTEEQDCINGANVLLNAVSGIAQATG